MENASKALIMAGGILIAILVVSLLVLGWNRISDYNRQQDETKTLDQIVKLNKEFESYNKKVVYGYEIISLNNLIEDTNERNSATDGYKPIEGHIKLLRDTTLINQLADREKNTWMGNGGSFSDFFEKIYNKAVDGGQKEFAKIFKESYFECTRVDYDGTVEKDGNVSDSGQGSGRIQKLYFEQITRKE